MHAALWVRLAVGVTLAAMVAVTSAAGRNEPRTLPELLVDLARDYGLNQRGPRTAADVQHVRTLLRAALRLDPQHSEAHVWLYELAVLGGDAAEAARMVTGLLESDPTHEGAFALWLGAGLRAQQTVEKRIEWLQAVAAAQRPAPLRAQVHVELARLALERLDESAARQELTRALELEPANVLAATLLWQTLDADSPPAERLAAILRVLQLDPAATEAAWQAGVLLDEHGLNEPAGRLLDYARDLRRRLAPQAPLPGGLLLDLARNRLAGGDADAALELVGLAATDPQASAEALMLVHHLLTRAGRSSDADAVQRKLSDRFAALAEPQDWPVNEVAQAAWYYCTIDPQPHLALPRAESAFRRASQDAFVRRVLGWAQALSEQRADAERTVAPLAGTDAWAACLLGKLRLEAGDREGAARALAELDPRPTCGPAAAELARLEAELTGATQPADSQPASAPTTQPESSQARATRRALRRVLKEFDDAALDFFATPARFLEARLTLDDVSPGPGEPWRATFALTNRASFPITLGLDGMVNPVFLLSFQMEGDRPRQFVNVMTISMDQVRVLHPGQTVSVRRTLDVGPLRQAARQTPQHLQRVAVQAVLDAEQDPNGVWRPSLGGQVLRPAYFNRVPAATGPEALAALNKALAGGTATSRARAIAVAAELLAERQQAELKRLSYTPASVPVDELRGALLAALGSRDWAAQVSALESLQLLGLDRALTAAVERCLDHEHWLARLMALRVLARQGPALAERMRAIAANDADELVRDLAASYVVRWAEREPPAAPVPTSAPASAPSAAEVSPKSNGD